MSLCPHKRHAARCPDCPPRGHTVGRIIQPRRAWALPARVEGMVEVRREHEDGAGGWVTRHFTRRGADRAIRLWHERGITRGFRP